MSSTQRSDITGNLTFGVVFILIGALVLLHELDVLTLSWRYVLPLVLIIAGIAVIISSQVSQRGRG